MSAEDLQRHEISKWPNRGRQAKAEEGGCAGYGSPAFGQQSVDGELVDEPAERETVELIRRHHKSGKSLQTLQKTADWLNQRGYTTKRGRSRRAAQRV